MLFNANLKASKVLVDLEYAPDPLEHTFALVIQNNHTSGLYFKIVCNVPNWSVVSPADGKIGLIDSGGVVQLGIKIQRSNPFSEITETGTLTLEAYTDSDYTNLLDSDDLDVEIDIIDIKSWDVQGWTFDDGTAQGWTISGSISDERSVIAGGYSMKDGVSNGSKAAYIEKSITIPSGSKAAGMVYFKARLAAGENNWTKLDKFIVKVNGEKIFEWGGYGYVYYYFRSAVGTYYDEKPWCKLVFDLSDYIGQTITLRIEFVIVSSSDREMVIYVDDPAVGVK